MPPELPRSEWGKIASGHAQQPSDALAIYIRDTTYGQDYANDDDWVEASNALKATLESEFKLPFETTDIGPGWSEPAFITLLFEHAGDALALFLLGKKITDGWDWWSSTFDKLRRFFKRKPIFSWEGAAILAIQAVRELLGCDPSSIQMVGYTTWRELGVSIDLEEELPPRTIEKPTEDLRLGVTTHFFLIEADGRQFKVAVEGHDVTVLELQ